MESPNKVNEVDDCHSHVQPCLPKPIVRPWEELVHIKHRLGLGYKEVVTFFIPDHSKPNQFQSARFLNESSSLDLPSKSFFDNSKYWLFISSSSTSVFASL